MRFAKQILKRSVRWVAANPAKTAELAIALTLVGTALVTTGRLDWRALRRFARVWL